MMFIELVMSLFGIPANPIEGIVLLTLAVFIFMEILEWLFYTIYLLITPSRRM